MFWQKLGLLESIFNKNYSIFSLIFPFKKKFKLFLVNLFCQYSLLLTKEKHVFRHVKDKKEIVTLLAMISL